VGGTARLYFLVARKRRRAVVFRRGPSRQVELLAWDLGTDTMTAGQWLKGRIYERRSDLSPSGELLIYFAAKYETGMRTWTAISRPPYLTALALWPKGDAWGGGGLFEAEHRIGLNHAASDTRLGEGFRVSSPYRVAPVASWAGAGEDFPILETRLLRDGWRVIGERSESRMQSWAAPISFVIDPPWVYERSIGAGRSAATLEMSISGIGEREGAWYVTRYRLLRDGRVLRTLGRADWADADLNGDLLLAQAGRLYRLRSDTADGWAEAPLSEVADLRDHVFEARTAPADAARW